MRTRRIATLEYIDTTTVYYIATYAYKQSGDKHRDTKY